MSNIKRSKNINTEHNRLLTWHVSENNTRLDNFHHARSSHPLSSSAEIYGSWQQSVFYFSCQVDSSIHSWIVMSSVKTCMTEMLMKVTACIVKIPSSTWKVIPSPNSWHYTFNKRPGKSKVPMNLYNYKDAVAVGVGLSLGENRATTARSGHLWALHLHRVVCCVSCGELWWVLLQTADMISKDKVISVPVEQPYTRMFQKYCCNKV